MQPSGPSASTSPRLAVVIVNYESWPDVERLIATLGSASEVRNGRAEVVVVDNASPEPMPESLANVPNGVRIIARRTNGGFAVGVNTGWAAAKGSWLLVLNPDVIPGEDLIAQVFRRIEEYERSTNPPGIVGFGLKNPDGSPQPSVGAFPSLSRTVWEQLLPRSRRKYQPDRRIRPGPVPWVTGACVLFDPRMLETVGGMDEDFFLYYEEVALCRSAANAGRRVEFDPSLTVVHLRPLQNRTISPKMRLITRHSKLLYFRKHLPRSQFVGLYAIIRLEAAIRGAWARLRGEHVDARAWKAVGRLARLLKTGSDLRGRDVLLYAEAAIEGWSD